MNLKLVFVAVVALAALIKASASRCESDWIHHQYSVLEISTTDIVTPSPLFFGTAPLQNGTSQSLPPISCDVWSNLLYNLNGTERVGFDVGLCTLTPAVNNTGSLYELCNIVHYFNNAADQVMLNGAITFDNQEEPQPFAVIGGVGAYVGASGTCTVQIDASLNGIYVCDFWTPRFRS